MTTHKHKCDCGIVFEHGEECRDNSSAHRCPSCGVEVWNRYHGNEEVTDMAKPKRPKPNPKPGY